MKGEEKGKEGYEGGGENVKYTFGLFEMSLAIKRRMFWCVRLLLSFLCSAAIQEGISSGVVPCGDRQTYTHAHMNTNKNTRVHEHIVGSHYHGNRFFSIFIERHGQSTSSFVS